MKYARIVALDYHLPGTVRTNEEIAEKFSEWTSQKILDKTGIRERRIADEAETATDLGIVAARKLIENRQIDPGTIDAVILCTQSPDYFLPSGANRIQSELGILRTAGAFDINQGCSGFVYGLAVANGMIASGISERVLLVTADTYSKYLDPKDKSVLTLFGDAAAATLVESDSHLEGDGEAWIGPFELGSDGSGASKLIVEAGGHRDISRTDRPFLRMDGPSIFSFSLTTVSSAVKRLLEKSAMLLDDIDVHVFHQANAFMLDAIRKRIGIPEDRFVVDMSDVGNTVSSSIPIALSRYLNNRDPRLGPQTFLFAGFGVGLSWAICLARI